MEKPKKVVIKDNRTFFEMQEDAWFSNNCQGAIEDYDGTEEGEE